MNPALFDVEVRPGDLVLFRGNSTLGKLIRWAETSKGEGITWANHAGMIVTKSKLRNAVLIESVWKTEKRPLVENHIGEGLSIFRYRMLTPEQQYALVRKMHEFVGDKYGWQRLIAHLVDQRVFGGRTVLRWLGHQEQNRPICSYSTGLSYEFVDITFGMPAIALQPDDMDDYCINNVIPWQPIVFRERLERVSA